MYLEEEVECLKVAIRVDNTEGEVCNAYANPHCYALA